MQTGTLNNVWELCLHKVFPHLAREKCRVAALTIRAEDSIRSHSELSKKLQDEIESNHFATVLQYEKIEQSK